MAGERSALVMAAAASPTKAAARTPASRAPALAAQRRPSRRPATTNRCTVPVATKVNARAVRAPPNGIGVDGQRWQHCEEPLDADRSEGEREAPASRKATAPMTRKVRATRDRAAVSDAGEAGGSRRRQRRRLRP